MTDGRTNGSHNKVMKPFKRTRLSHFLEEVRKDHEGKEYYQSLIDYIVENWSEDWGENWIYGLPELFARRWEKARAKAQAEQAKAIKEVAVKCLRHGRKVAEVQSWTDLTEEEILLLEVFEVELNGSKIKIGVGLENNDMWRS